MVLALAARRTGAARAEKEADKAQTTVKARMSIQGMGSFGMLTVKMKERRACPKEI